MTRVVLDTGVFFRPAALRELSHSDDTVVVPAVVYAERLRQLVQKGMEPHAWDAKLAQLQFDVEPFGPMQAQRYVPRLARVEPAEWRRLSHDAMIAGHLQPADRLWTTNARDFLALGVPPEQVVSV